VSENHANDDQCTNGIHDLTVRPDMGERGGSVGMPSMLWKRRDSTERALGFCPAIFTITRHQP